MPGTSNSRQIGFQETDIVSIAKPITKSIQLRKAEDIYSIRRFIYLCAIRKKRTVLLDLPMCQLQGIVLRKYKAKNTKIKIANISKIFKIIKNAKRPVILSGGGVRYSNAVNEFNNLIKNFNIPVVSSWSGVDTIDSKISFIMDT